ncbi:unnamed protein product [Schistocephalus solidus]|uniref:PLAT domain-containing protein n=1 Tax=Schistocephalus solidus TaxID=70667 RepID=A0A183SD26_SCHSO|nr:unnamed protein product [Schistocephalus solidus]
MIPLYCINFEAFYRTQQESTFSFSALPDLGALLRCTLWHDNADDSAEWHCEWVRVGEMLPPINGLLLREWFFDCNQWVSAKQGNKECCVELNSSSGGVVDPLNARTAGEEIVREMKVTSTLREEDGNNGCKSVDTGTSFSPHITTHLL